MTPIQSFVSKFQVDRSTGCWLWTASLQGHGYGAFWVKEKLYAAHRWSYAYFMSDPGELLVCHTCDIKHCVNPTHLFLGTNLDNVLDAYRKGIHKRKLTSEQVLLIRKLRELKVPRSKVAKLYGVGLDAIKDIDKKRTWAWVK